MIPPRKHRSCLLPPGTGQNDHLPDGSFSVRRGKAAALSSVCLGAAATSCGALLPPPHPAADVACNVDEDMTLGVHFCIHSVSRRVCLLGSGIFVLFAPFFSLLGL